MTGSELLSGVFLLGWLAAGLRQATPLLFAASGEIWSQRSGVLNVGLEGYMLIGALAGFLGAYYGGDSALLGLACAGLAGLAVAGIMALLMVRLGVDQVVAGIALNVAVLGLTSFTYQQLLAGSMVPPSINGLPRMAGDLDVTVLVALLLVPLSWFFMSRTHFGLSVKAAGEHPKAADAQGVRVHGVRTTCCLLAGLGGSLGGACLSLGQIHLFVENMTAGRGFIALAIVVFATWSPWKALGACLLFGLADGLQLRLQGLGLAVPREILMMMPYVLCIVVLVARLKQSRPPTHLAIPYDREVEVF